jgi:hypothetical protein
MKLDSIQLPLAAGLWSSRLQARTMNSKHNLLHQAGYDYGDNLRGTGEGWHYYASVKCIRVDSTCVTMSHRCSIF